MITFHETAPRMKRRKNNQQRNSTKKKERYFSLGFLVRPLFKRMEHEMNVVLCGDSSIIIKEFKLIIFVLFFIESRFLSHFSLIFFFGAKMETTSVVTQSFDHQQVSKNKRKKFNPKYMLTNSSSDEEGGRMTKDDDRDQIDDQSSCDDDDHLRHSSDDISGQIPNANFSITKNNRSNNGSPPPPLATAQSMMNPFLSPSKMSLLQTFNLQQQQQLFQQAAISAIAPQFSQQLGSSANLSETEVKFREFAFKTMQELLNIYGLSLPPNEILDAMKNQQTSEYSMIGSNQF